MFDEREVEKQEFEVPVVWNNDTFSEKSYQPLSHVHSRDYLSKRLVANNNENSGIPTSYQHSQTTSPGKVPRGDRRPFRPTVNKIDNDNRRVKYSEQLESSKLLWGFWQWKDGPFVSHSHRCFMLTTDSFLLSSAQSFLQPRLCFRLWLFNMLFVLKLNILDLGKKHWNPLSRIGNQIMLSKQYFQ